MFLKIKIHNSYRLYEYCILLVMYHFEKIVNLSLSKVSSLLYYSSFDPSVTQVRLSST